MSYRKVTGSLLARNAPVAAVGRADFITKSWRSRRGIALISVLAMVMLLTALSVAFMMRAGTERQASTYYCAEARTRDLSDTTLNMVEGLINEATTQGMTFSWASQPGAIRVFDSNGNPAKSFKLYSAPSMVATTTSLTLDPNSVASFFGADLPPATWYNSPGIWVDLNAPVNSDPNPNAAGLGSPLFTHFPILDPRDPVNSKNTIAMDGFALPPVTSPATKVPFDTTNIDTNNLPNPAPMPVQWLYVLQNGTLTAPNSGPDAAGNYTLAVSPTLANPIVGRIAFWTDDETCKVNVNTAGADGIMNNKYGIAKNVTPDGRPDPSAIADGTFWSPPYYAAIDDVAPDLTTGSGPFGPGFCSSLPAQGEYQRYPGHPATVALSNILNTLRPSAATPYFNTTTFYSQSTSTAGANGNFTSQVTAPGITPRYVYGGTQEGTVNTYGSGAWGTVSALTYGSIANAAYRLYPTLSEALFTPSRTVSNLNTTDSSARQRMETGRFFLTAHSRAPELNLFGLPRVSIWPMSSTPAWRTPTDNLIGFCTTIGGTQGSTTNGSAYYFTRSSSYDSTVDIGLKDSSNNYRNAMLLNYLDYVTKQNIPGFGGSFYTKDYGSGTGLTGQTDQILTEIFDYVRATNIRDAASPSPYGCPWYTGWQGGIGGTGQVVPSLINSANSGGLLNWNTQGYGSFPRLVEVTLQFVAMGRGGVPANAYGPNNPPGNINAIPINPALVAFAFPNPMPASYVPPALPPAPGSPAYVAFASANPLGYLLGYPQTPPSPLPPFAQGDAPNFPLANPPIPPCSTLTYAYKPLVSPFTTPTPSLDLPYAPPGAIDPACTPAPTATGPYTTIYRVHNYETGLDSAIPPDGTNAVQAFVCLTFLNPAQDWLFCLPYVWGSISGLGGMAINGHSLGFTDPDCMIFQANQNDHATEGTGDRSGYIPMECSYRYKSLYRVPGQINNNPNWGYPFFSNIIPITSDNTLNSKMSFTGSTVIIKLYDAPGGASGITPTPDLTGAPTGPAAHLLQTYTINFSSNITIPVPVLPPTVNSYPPNSQLPIAGYSVPTWLAWITPNIAYGVSTLPGSPSPQIKCFEQTGPLIGMPSSGPAGSTPQPNWPQLWSVYDRWNTYQQPFYGIHEDFIGPGDVLESMVLSKTWSDPRLLAIANVPASAFVTHPEWGQQFAHNLYVSEARPDVGNGTWSAPAWAGYPLYPNATPSVGTLAGNVVEPQPVGYPAFPWAPSVFGNNKSPTTVSGAAPDWDSGVVNSDGPWINKADEGSGSSDLPYYGNPIDQDIPLFTANREVSSPGMLGSLPTGVDPSGIKPAGWQTLLFKPGPGAANALASYNGLTPTSGPPHPGEGIPVNSGLYGPPYSSPPDHLWMDLFWLPVTEPYAISEPMSTAGKINLNYQILPFTYIKRATALRAAMATEKIAQVGLLQSGGYKGYDNMLGIVADGPWIKYGSQLNQQIPARYPIDLDVTVSQFDHKFASWDIFRSASQICENFLVPMDIPNTLPNATAKAAMTPGAYFEIVSPCGNYSRPATSGDTAGVAAFAKDWYTPVATPQNSAAYTNAPFAMVGDNLKEQPYAHLYGKLTTKSNTFTVYYRVQSLKEPSALTSAGEWNESRGTITGEYRGSTTIERFIDPNEKTGGVNVVPDAAMEVANGNTPTSLEAYYKWRVVENHQFAP